MPQLYFKYATMNAGKSIEVIKVVYNYEEHGKRVLLLTSALDTRYKKGFVTSRTGMEMPAGLIEADTNVFELVKESIASQESQLFCVIVDESQFLKEHHVYEFARVVDELGIPVMCFGLKNDFRNRLFEGSEALLRLADKLEEIKTVCSSSMCEKKATMVLRYDNGVPVTDGPQVLIGGNSTYKAVCRKHYFSPETR